jgi:hypothetical protein
VPHHGAFCIAAPQTQTATICPAGLTEWHPRYLSGSVVFLPTCGGYGRAPTRKFQKQVLAAASAEDVFLRLANIS